MEDIMFVGLGTSAALGSPARIGPWYRDEDRPPVTDETAKGHPAGYRAGEELVDAVNTALLLKKPLLLTGNPGTGKSELAQRVAWELGLSPVLRFDAQSLSEANDLFYRFDLVRHVAASHTARPKEAGEPDNADPHDFISFGPLGKAILRSAPGTPEHAKFWEKAFPNQKQRPTSGLGSVVLIDEIDKASRDFPNDLLNAIERLDVPIREIPNARLRVSEDAYVRPVIVITSNSERELPAPFLRRCVFCHIPDPKPDVLREIVRARVFPETLAKGKDAPAGLPTLYEQLLQFFVHQRDVKKGLAYACGPAELIDWSNALRANLAHQPDHKPTDGILEHEKLVKRALGALAKHRNDRDLLLAGLREQFKLP